MTLAHRFSLLMSAFLAVLGVAEFAAAQMQEPLWTYPRAQPFFDLPWQRRLDTCIAPPAAWQCDPPGNGEPSGGCDACDADNECGEGLDYDGCPRWMARRKCGFYMTADFAPLRYDNNTHAQFARAGAAGPFVLSDASLPMDFDSGGRFVMGCQYHCRLGIEGSYQGFYNYSDQAGVRNAAVNTGNGIGNLQSPFSNFGVPPLAGVDNNNLVAISLRNRFHTADLNHTYRLDMPPGPFDVQFLVGVRYAQIDELFRYQSQTNTPTVAVVSQDIAVDTSNVMWGPQLGFTTSTLVTERAWCDFTLKGSLLNDSARQQTVVTTNTNGQIAALNGQATGNRTAFMLDGLLIGNFQLTRGLSFHGGYQAYWVDGVALGIGNFQTNLPQLLAGPTLLNHGSTAIYHGPVLGLTWAR